jgi:predicted transcriptional regulator
VIRAVHEALARPERESQPDPTSEHKGPVEIRRSVRPDSLVSFIDGKVYKQLKRHLSTHGMTPAQYRDRFGLPDTYPMVAPEYSARRSAFAKASGLGRGEKRKRAGAKG